MRIQDKIERGRGVVLPSGKIVYLTDVNAILDECKAAADVVEAIHVALKMGCSGNDILEKDSAIRSAIESIMGEAK